jgi:hypothetical protein
MRNETTCCPLWLEDSLDKQVMLRGLELGTVHGMSKYIVNRTTPGAMKPFTWWAYELLI